MIAKKSLLMTVIGIWKLFSWIRVVFPLILFPTVASARALEEKLNSLIFLLLEVSKLSSPAG